MSDFSGRVRRLLETYDPEKVSTADALLKAFSGREEKLIESLVKRYGPEPAAAVAPKAVPPRPGPVAAAGSAPGKKMSPKRASPVDTAVAPSTSPSKKMKKRPASPGKAPPSPAAATPTPKTPTPAPPTPIPETDEPDTPSPAKKPVAAPSKKMMVKRPMSPSPAAAKPQSPPPASASPREVVSSIPQSPTTTHLSTGTPTNLSMVELPPAGAEGQPAIVEPPPLGKPLAGEEHAIRLAALSRTILDFYRKVAPDRVHQVDDLVQSFAFEEQRLFAQLELKYRYGVAPKMEKKKSFGQRPGTEAAELMPDPRKTPVYPAGYLQRQFTTNIQRESLKTAARDQIVSARLAAGKGALDRTTVEQEVNDLLASRAGRERSTAEEELRKALRLLGPQGASQLQRSVWMEVIESMEKAIGEDAEWTNQLVKFLQERHGEDVVPPEGAFEVERLLAAHAQDAKVWELIHRHHQTVRHSLFVGDHVLGEGGDASALTASAGGGFASTCDVTPRQLVQALVYTHCPSYEPLILHALWLYRGREHQLVTKLHREYGIDGPKGSAGSATYLSAVMSGLVSGLGQEAGIETQLKLSNEGGAAPARPEDPAGTLPAVYPCEDVAFRSWSNVPPALHSVAHMARHFGLGPQVVHQLHAQHPDDPNSAAFELLCMLFPDAVYLMLGDEDQRLAFMARRVSEIVSFIGTCGPPAGDENSAPSGDPIGVIPRLFQRFSPLSLESDETKEQRRLLQENAPRFVRKPPRDKADAEEGGGTSSANKGVPEAPLLQLFSEHFGHLLEDCAHVSVPWEDMYAHVNAERHDKLVGNLRRWASAYGPSRLPIRVDPLPPPEKGASTTEEGGEEGEDEAEGADTMLQAPPPTALLHRLACTKLTRSTPLTYTSILKPWLRDTRTAGTMTSNDNDLRVFRTLNCTDASTCTSEDGALPPSIDDEKYARWPVPFRYEEEYRQQLERMDTTELRRERHRALFGDPRAMANPAGQVVFGGGDTGDKYRAMRAYEQWWDEEVGESGRGRYHYKQRPDPEREMRRQHRAAYFGDDRSDDEDVYGTATFDPSKQRPDFARALVKRGSPHWFDHDLADYEDFDDHTLAMRTTGPAVAGLIQKYRQAQAMLHDAAALIKDMDVELAAAQRARQQPPAPCDRCTRLEDEVKTLTRRVHDLRQSKSSYVAGPTSPVPSTQHNASTRMLSPAHVDTLGLVGTPSSRAARHIAAPASDDSLLDML